MIEVSRFKADDGIEFIGKDSCLEHEVNCGVARSIMRHLDERPDSCAFSNGSGYIQHDPEKPSTVMDLFLEFAKRYTDHKCIQGVIDRNTHISHADRMLGEVLPNSIHKHWFRFSCIDGQGREWGQPYYVKNPQDATQKKLN